MPRAISEAIEGAKTILLTTAELDGDAVGAISALAIVVGRRWPDKAIRIVTDERLPARYAFLEHAPGVYQAAVDVPVEPIDLGIVLDGDPERLRSATPHYEASRVRGLIDHHKTSVHVSVDVALLDIHAASTTELVLELCDLWGVEVDRAIARPIFAGMVFDTSIFRYRMTRPSTLRAAARLLETGIDHAKIVEEVLLQQPEDKVRLRGRMIEKMRRDEDGRMAWATLTHAEMNGTEAGGLVDDLVFIEGVEVAALLNERSDGTIKLSLRSRGEIDVSSVARELSPQGGGHARAAGATLHGSLDEAAARVVECAKKSLDRGPSH